MNMFYGSKDCFELFDKYFTDGIDYYRPTQISRDNDILSMECDRLVMNNNMSSIVHRTPFSYNSNMKIISMQEYDSVVEAIKMKYYLAKNIFDTNLKILAKYNFSLEKRIIFGKDNDIKYSVIFSYSEKYYNFILFELDDSKYEDEFIYGNSLTCTISLDTEYYGRDLNPVYITQLTEQLNQKIQVCGMKNPAISVEITQNEYNELKDIMFQLKNISVK